MPMPSTTDYINPIDSPYNAAGDFNLTTKTGTADNAAVQAAMNDAVAQNKVLRITRVHRLAQSNVTGTAAGDIQIPDGLVMVCDPGAGFAYDAVILPAMWKRGAGRFWASDLSMYFFGTAPVDQAPYVKYSTAYTDWTNNRCPPDAGADAVTYGGYDVPGTALFLMGGNIRLIRPRFVSLVAEGTAKEDRQYMMCCIFMNGINTATPITGHIDDAVFDGYHMGIAGTWWKDFAINRPRWHRYGGGGSDASWGYNPPPRHCIYNTAGNTKLKAQRGVVTLIEPMDYGVDHAEVSGGLAAYKFNGSSRVVIRGGFTFCPHGPLQGICEDWDIVGLYAASAYARHATATTNAVTAGIALLQDNYATADGGGVITNGGRIEMRWRETGTPVQAINSANGAMLRILLDLSVDVVTSLGLWVAGGMTAQTRTVVRAAIRADTPGNISSLGNLFNASVGNRVEVESFDVTNISTGNLGQLRAIEQDKAAASKNTLKFTDLNNGSTIETFDDGLTVTRMVKKVAVNAASGASITSAGFIPAGARNVSISAVVKTALGATNGVTGFMLGVTGDADRFGVFTGTAVGSGSSGTLASYPSKKPLINSTGGTADVASTLQAITAGASYAQADMTAVKNALATIAARLEAPWSYEAAQNVIITAVGGNFDGTGVIQINLAYEVASQTNQAY